MIKIWEMDIDLESFTTTPRQNTGPNFKERGFIIIPLKIKFSQIFIYFSWKDEGKDKRGKGEINPKSERNSKK